MQIVILCDINKDKLEALKQHVRDLDPDAVFTDTPLEAFAEQEGPYRINEFIERDDLPIFDDEDLNKEIVDAATTNIRAALMGETDDKSPMDGDVLEDIAMDAAKNVLKGRLDNLGPKDKEKAKEALEWL